MPEELVVQIDPASFRTYPPNSGLGAYHQNGFGDCCIGGDNMEVVLGCMHWSWSKFPRVDGNFCSQESYNVQFFGVPQGLKQVWQSRLTPPFDDLGWAIGTTKLFRSSLASSLDTLWKLQFLEYSLCRRSHNLWFTILRYLHSYTQCINGLFIHLIHPWCVGDAVGAQKP